MHVTGASGAGKSTLANKLRELYPDKYTILDLDDQDNEAENLVGSADEKKLIDKRQELFNAFHATAKLPLVVVGNHRQGSYTLKIPAGKFYYLDTSPEESAKRAYKRSQREPRKYQRLLRDLPFDVQEAEEEIKALKKSGYKMKSAESIINGLGHRISMSLQPFANVICHIAGPSGAGKTTLGKLINEYIPNLKVVDTDEIDDKALARLAWKDRDRQKFSYRDVKELYKVKQQILDDYLSETKSPVVLVGLINEAGSSLKPRTNNRFLLKVTPQEAVRRAYSRAIKLGEEESFDKNKKLFEAKKDDRWYRLRSYKSMSNGDIIKFILWWLDRPENSELVEKVENVK